MRASHNQSEEQLLIELRRLTAQRLAAAERKQWEAARVLAEQRAACVADLSNARLRAAASVFGDPRTLV